MLEQMAALVRMRDVYRSHVSEVRSYQRVFLFHLPVRLPPPARLAAVGAFRCET